MIDDLPFSPPEPEAARTVVRSEKPCLHPRKFRTDTEQGVRCTRCGRDIRPDAMRRGRQSRNYGNRAELEAARRYGGQKVGHAGGPVDIRGRDWNTQMKTHRRLPPVEWTKAFAALSASTDRLPRLLLRFVRPGNLGPDDYFVIPAKAWLDWFGKDE